MLGCDRAEAGRSARHSGRSSCLWPAPAAAPRRPVRSHRARRPRPTRPRVRRCPRRRRPATRPRCPRSRRRRPTGAARPASSHGRHRRRRDDAHDRRLPAVPGRQPLAAQRVGRPARSAFGGVGREHRRQHSSAPRLRQRPELRHPLRRRARPSSRWCRSPSPRTATRATPARTRCRSMRRSRPAVTRTCWSPRPTAISTSSTTRSGRARAGRPIRARCSTSNSDALRPERLDLGRRGRPADPARPGAPRRGRVRPHQPRAAVHGLEVADAASSTRRRIRPARPATRTCRRWARGSG